MVDHVEKKSAKPQLEAIEVNSFIAKTTSIFI